MVEGTMFRRITRKEDAELLMRIVMRAGAIMLEYGAEIYRVEDTVTRILSSKTNIEDVQVVCTYSSIMISFYYDGNSVTLINKIKGKGINLDKISQVNDFSRDFVANDMSIVEADIVVTEIENSPAYAEWKKVLAGAVGTAFLALTLKGTITDAFVAGLVVFIVQIILATTEIMGDQYFIEILYSGFSSALISVILTRIFPSLDLDIIVISSIYLLFPGITLTNAVRDVMNGDMLSGLLGFLQAGFVAVILAVGVGLVLMFNSLIGGF